MIRGRKILIKMHVIGEQICNPSNDVRIEMISSTNIDIKMAKRTSL